MPTCPIVIGSLISNNCLCILMKFTDIISYHLLSPLAVKRVHRQEKTAKYLTDNLEVSDLASDVFFLQLSAFPRFLIQIQIPIFSRSSAFLRFCEFNKLICFRYYFYFYLFSIYWSSWGPCNMRSQSNRRVSSSCVNWCKRLNRIKYIHSPDNYVM